MDFFFFFSFLEQSVLAWEENRKWHILKKLCIGQGLKFKSLLPHTSEFPVKLALISEQGVESASDGMLKI